MAAAGGSLAEGVQGVEVPPLLSYAGEGLQQLVAGKVLGKAGEEAVLLDATRFSR